MRRKTIFSHCLLFFAAAFFLLLQSPADAATASVESVIAGHNTCDQCHGRFTDGARPGKADSESGRPARIPAKKVDILCLGCHGPAGISKLKADVHGKQNYGGKPIGCITCHDPHDNNPNYLDGQNIKLIGDDKWDDSNSYAMIRTPRAGKRFVVFESLGINRGDPSLHSFADGDEDSNGVFDGVCETCHTRTKYHRNNPGGDHGHFAGTTCTDCHTHVNQFLAFSDNPVVTRYLSGSVVDDSGRGWAGITLFLDINGNGTYDPGEPTAVTNANGIFTFEGQADNGYDVLIMPGSIPDGYAVTVSTVDGRVIITITSRNLVYPTRLTWKADGGYFLADSMGNALFFYDADGNQTGKLKELDRPLGIATDARGRIYVGNMGRGNVEVYSAGGVLQQVIGDGTVLKPNDMAFDRDQRLYVVDSTSKNVRVFNPDGTDAQTIGQTVDTQHFLSPRTLAIHYRTVDGVEKGELYVGDSSSALVKVFDLQGNLLRTLGETEEATSGGGGMGMGWGDTTTIVKLFHGIQSLEFDQNGHLHVLDTYMDMVNIIDPVTGALLSQYTTDVNGQEAQLPMDIAIGTGGRVIMTSARTKSVQTIYTVQ